MMKVIDGLCKYHRSYHRTCLVQGFDGESSSFERLHRVVRGHGYPGITRLASFIAMLNEGGKLNPDAIERQLAHMENNGVRRAYTRGEFWDERF